MNANNSRATDAQLVARWQAGDARAGDILLARYLTDLDRYLYSKIGAKVGRANVEDVRQDTLIAVSRAIPSYRGEASFRTFLYAIANRKLLDRLKHAHTGRGKVNVSHCSIEDIFGFCEFEDPLTRECSVLIEALRSLPIEDQILIELRYLEGLSYRELAEVSGERCSIGTLKWRVARAKDRLREALRERDEVILDDAPARALDSTSLATRLRRLRDAITALLAPPTGQTA